MGRLYWSTLILLCSIECGSICREFVEEKGILMHPTGFHSSQSVFFFVIPALLFHHFFSLAHSFSNWSPFLAHISYLLSPFLPPSSRGIHSCHSHSKPRLPRAAGQTVVCVCVCAQVRVYGCGPPCLQLSPKYFYIYDLALLVHSWSIQV